MSAVADPSLQPRAAADPETLSTPNGLMATRDAPLGGQAVLEGVMMRGISTWAVAVRKPAAESGAAAEDVDRSLGEIAITVRPLRSALRRHRLLRLPLVRGVVALGESLAIGLRAMGIAANAQLPPPEPEGDGSPREEASSGEISTGVWVATILVAGVLAVALFFVAPLLATNSLRHQLGSASAFWAVEGALRTAIFFGYLALLARLRDLRRVFEYHGAEHKTISCYEAGLDLTPANAGRFSRLHPRCGTSFLLVVMIVAIFVFAPIGLRAWWILLLTRIAGIPLIAGISFELIKLAARHRRRPWVRALMWPGMQLQRLTTREPDESQLAVAIAALEAVLRVETPGSARADELVGLEVVA
jgi:uncharacterized protein YqhQ